MLHTFSATAYEILEYNVENLLKYGFLKIDIELQKTIQFGQVKLNSKESLDTLDNPIYYLDFEFEPYTKPLIDITFLNGAAYEFKLGEQGQYVVPSDALVDNPVIKINNKSDTQITINYGYYSNYSPVKSQCD